MEINNVVGAMLVNSRSASDHSGRLEARDSGDAATLCCSPTMSQRMDGLCQSAGSMSGVLPVDTSCMQDIDDANGAHSRCSISGQFFVKVLFASAYFRQLVPV
jgi:hypothetical protein